MWRKKLSNMCMLPLIYPFCISHESIKSNLHIILSMSHVIPCETIAFKPQIHQPIIIYCVSKVWDLPCCPFTSCLFMGLKNFIKVPTNHPWHRVTLAQIPQQALGVMNIVHRQFVIEKGKSPISVYTIPLCDAINIVSTITLNCQINFIIPKDNQTSTSPLSAYT